MHAPRRGVQRWVDGMCSNMVGQRFMQAFRVQRWPFVSMPRPATVNSNYQQKFLVETIFHAASGSCSKLRRMPLPLTLFTKH
mmetsp:Transcript_12377/g.23749  ORF Transcript_12377/g.23749 Transcript_12377/m.23749 type:complete len:82 (-) Transcript_12377:242-487(-)